MPNDVPDHVNGMPDGDLRKALLSTGEEFINGVPIGALVREFARRYSSLRAEVERLKAEAVVMREYCAAKKPSQHPTTCICAECDKYRRARLAYRAMEDEK